MEKQGPVEELGRCEAAEPSPDYPMIPIIKYEEFAWVVLVDGYATQGKTLHEALVSLHDMLMGLVIVHEREGAPLPDDFPLSPKNLEIFKREFQTETDDAGQIV